MTTVGPVTFYQAGLLEDLGAIVAGGSGYLVSIEHTREVVPSALEAPAEKTTWRFWQPEREGAGFRQAAQSTVVLPVAAAVAMAVQKNRLFAVALVNEPRPAYLLSWELKGGAPPQPGESSSRTAPLELERQEAAQVRIDPRQDWNTRRLPSTRWLFHPSLASLRDGSGVAIAMNTADGRAVVWSSDGSDKPKRRLAWVPGALNPVLVHLGGKNRLYYRRMPGEWPVFYHDERYSGQYGPVALPLCAAELDAGGGIAHTADLSKDKGVGNVFAFAVDSTGGDRLALAAITGTAEKPELRVYVEGAAGALRLRHTAALRQVPFRLTMAVAGDHALIGLAQEGEHGYELEGLLVPLG